MRFYESNKIKINRFLVRVRSFLRGHRSKELLTFLFFVLISSFFWSLQWMKESVETDFSIPVRVVNVPADIILTSELPKFLNVRVKDKGATIFSYYFSRPLPVYEIDFRTLTLNKGVVKISPDLIASRLRKKFAASVEVLSFFPESLSLSFSKGESKQVSVLLVSSITTAASYGLSGDLKIFPSRVSIFAPSEKLLQISRLYTETLTLRGVKDSMATIVRLRKIDNVKMVPDQVKVFLSAEPFTEKRLDVPVEGLNVPVGFTMRIFPVKVNVVCYVAISRYNAVNASDFRLGVDFKSIADSKNMKFPVRLIKSPENVSKVRFQPEEVEVLMEELP